MSTEQPLNSWDPLDGNMDQEMMSASAKRSITNILKSYVGTFDPFAELIQNALDAVDKKAEQLSEIGLVDDYKKSIWLFINIKNNSFTIVDNGIGFKEQEFKSFLAPSISFKDSKKNRGNKGVGATYIAYGFNHLELGTKGEEFDFTGEIRDGRNWVDDFEGKVARPKIKRKPLNNELFETLDSGTLFTLRFGGISTRPKNLSWYQASTAEQWRYLLLTKTPLGSVNYHFTHEQKIHFHLEVIDQNGFKTQINDFASYQYPHILINASKNLSDIRAEQEKLLSRGSDVSKISKKYSNLNGIYDIYTPQQINKLPTNQIDSHHKELIELYDVHAYGYFCYSTTVWDTLNDDVAKLRKNFRFLKGGIQLANNSMVQGDLLVIPLTQNIGYQNQTHVVIHFKNADPDLGRKGFQPELKELAEVIAVGIVNSLKAWRHLLKQDKGNKPDIEREANLYDWVKREEEFERNHPLSITNPNFFNPINEISISSEPQTEQDTIVLFSQLLAGGVIRGIKLLSTSQYMQYDGLYKFIVAHPLENHVYDEFKNPLGILVENFRETVSKPRVLEYKYSMDALIHEFENHEKQEKDVSLAVVWDIGAEWNRNYEVMSLLDIENLHHRQFHGITHTFHTPSGGRFDAIVLRELIQYLNDPIQSQIDQAEKYSNESL
nr:ATP-binding protein [uncultured Mucilaginibacter sp.]